MESTDVTWTHKPHQASNLGVFLSCCTLVTFPWAVWSYLQTRSTEYRIQGDKLYLRRGIWQIKEYEVHLWRIKSIRSPQTLAALLGTHSLKIDTENDLLPTLTIRGINNLAETKSLILLQINRHKQAVGVPLIAEGPSPRCRSDDS